MGQHENNEWWCKLDNNLGGKKMKIVKLESKSIDNSRFQIIGDIKDIDNNVIGQGVVEIVTKDTLLREQSHLVEQLTRTQALKDVVDSKISAIDDLG